MVSARPLLAVAWAALVLSTAAGDDAHGRRLQQRGAATPAPEVAVEVVPIVAGPAPTSERVVAALPAPERAVAAAPSAELVRPEAVPAVLPGRFAPTPEGLVTAGPLPGQFAPAPERQQLAPTAEGAVAAEPLPARFAPAPEGAGLVAAAPAPERLAPSAEIAPAPLPERTELPPIVSPNKTTDGAGVVTPIPEYVPPPSPNPTVATGQSIAAALLAGDIDGAARQIAAASPEAVAAATTLSATEGTTLALSQAVCLAVSKYGADPAAIAGALSEATCGDIPPSAPASGKCDPQAINKAILAGIQGSVTVISEASASALDGAATATATAVSQAAADVCNGGSVEAAAAAAAQATARATATAQANASVTVTTEGCASGCGTASASATAVADAQAEAASQSIASAQCACAAAQSVASAQAISRNIAVASVSVSATACASNGGDASASASATSTVEAVASAATQTYAAAFATLASCNAPPAPGPVSPASLTCVLLPNTNLNGDVVESTTAADAGACCELCKRRTGCNTFAYCPLPPPGCDNGYGTFYRSRECTLKSQQLAADSLPTWYSRGPGIPWIGGYLTAAAAPTDGSA